MATGLSNVRKQESSNKQISLLCISVYMVRHMWVIGRFTPSEQFFSYIMAKKVNFQW